MVGRERLWQQVEACSSKADIGSPRPSNVAPTSTFPPKAAPKQRENSGCGFVLLNLSSRTCLGPSLAAH